VEKFEHLAILMIPNFIPWLKGAFIPDHITMAWLVMITLAVVAFLATRRLSSVPGPLQNLLEVAIETFQDFLEGIIGPPGRKYLPLIGTLSLFIFFSNLLGLIPGLKSPTANLNTTLALAIIVFFSYHYFGIREQGPISYLKHFAGPVWWLAPLMLIVEPISHLSRVVSLAIRLFGNIFGEDTVILILAFLIPVIVPLPMMMLAIFTSAVQTLVFVMLTTVYISLAVEAGHEEHH
jgi:F-type H+-transporting ATPase subunit a